MSPFAVSTVEGAFAFGVGNPGNPSRFPYTTIQAGPLAPRGGPGGTAAFRFGWLGLDGLVRNTREAATDRIGFVFLPFEQPAKNTWQRNFWDATTKTYRIREGTEVDMLTRGAVWARFAGGAWPGQKVYASLVDGALISGYADDAELTPWLVQTAAAPGELAIINTFAYFGE